MRSVNEENVVVLIMAGGVGSRLWPISTAQRPKQFCHLTCSDKTMIQSIFSLAQSVVSDDRVFVSTSCDYKELVTNQLTTLDPGNIIEEPGQRGTTAAIAFATIQIRLRFPDAVMVVVSSDCVIGDAEDFRSAVRSAVSTSRLGSYLVSVGVVPTEAHTGYGYMQCGDSILPNVFEGTAYIEKPDKHKAQALLEAGGHLWNTGIFVWHVDVIIAAFRQYIPNSLSTLTNLENELAKPSTNQKRIEALYLCIRIPMVTP